MTDLVPVNGQAMSTFDIMPSCWELAQRITRTEFVPTALRGKPEAVMACMLTGHEVGMPPMMALKQIHVIEGRPTLSAEGMRALVLSRGHEVWFEDISTTRVTIVGVRAGTTRETRITWSMDDAKRAGLDSKQNWRKFPRPMLEARSTGELCRLIFADVIGGISYLREEIEDGILFEADDEPDGNGDAPTQTRKAAGTRKRAAKKAAAPPAQAGPPPQAPMPPLPGEDGTPPIATTAREEPTGESAEVVTQRAQQIAMRANNAGIDHHHVIAAVTFGAKSSAKEVTGDEGAEVLMAIREIAQGRKALDEVEDGWRLVDVSEDPGSGDVGTEPDSGAGEGEAVSGMPPSSPPSPPPPTPSSPATPGTGDEGTWDGDRWRAYVKEKGVTVTEALKQAQELAREMDSKVPTRLDEIAGNETLAGLLRGFIDEVALERGR